MSMADSVMLSDAATLLPVLLTFILAGLVKGLTGMGLPTVCLALLTVLLDLTSAMVLLLLPSLLTNIWQACSGGQMFFLWRRLWRFFVPATLLVAPGGMLLAGADLRWMSILLGAVLICYGLTGLTGLSLPARLARSHSTGFILGSLNGLLTGMTGSFVVPGVIYLQATGLNREQLIQAMGLLFTLSTLALGLSLQSNGILSRELGMVSAIGVIPAFVGMLTGQRLRQRLSEQRFRRLFLIVVLLLGGYIVWAGLS